MTTPTDYPYIRAWDRMMNSHGGWTEDQLTRARAEKAPPTATWRDLDGTWHTFDQITREETKALLERFVSERG